MSQLENKRVANKAVGKAKNLLTGEGSRITEATAILMVGTALLFDFLSIIPIINYIAAFFAWMTFGLWFLMKGIGFISPKKLATWSVSILVGLIPAISAFPELTVAVIITIAITRAEDQLGIVVPKTGVAGNPNKGGRSKFAKNRRRGQQTASHRREVARRRRSMDGVSANRQKGSGRPSFNRGLARPSPFNGVTQPLNA